MFDAARCLWSVSSMLLKTFKDVTAQHQMFITGTLCKSAVFPGVKELMLPGRVGVIIRL